MTSTRRLGLKGCEKSSEVFIWAGKQGLFLPFVPAAKGALPNMLCLLCMTLTLCFKQYHSLHPLHCAGVRGDDFIYDTACHHDQNTDLYACTLTHGQSCLNDASSVPAAKRRRSCWRRSHKTRTKPQLPAIPEGRRETWFRRTSNLGKTVKRALSSIFKHILDNWICAMKS